jgi:lysozyme
MSYTFSPNAVELIKQFEGFSTKAYPDPATKAEPITIGYGSTHYCNGTKVTLNDPPIDKDMAGEMLLCYLNKTILPDVLVHITNPNLTQNQIDAIGCLMYNIGDVNFDHSSLLQLINTNPNSPAIDAKWLAWDHAAGKELPGLLKRRTVELNFYKKH